MDKDAVRPFVVAADRRAAGLDRGGHGHDRPGLGWAQRGRRRAHGRREDVWTAFRRHHHRHGGDRLNDVAPADLLPRSAGLYDQSNLLKQRDSIRRTLVNSEQCFGHRAGSANRNVDRSRAERVQQGALAVSQVEHNVEARNGRQDHPHERDH